METSEEQPCTPYVGGAGSNHQGTQPKGKGPELGLDIETWEPAQRQLPKY
jgi:hypothetical protein